MIGNTHFDPVWLWRWDEAMASIRATFRSALDRMKEEPEFFYSFACPPVFEWIRETDEALFEEICARVAEGRWELGEAWWIQPDCYSASGESYVRQGLYGQRYLKKTFGKYAGCVFNIDSFGHSPMLPQILKKSRVTSYCLVRPEARHIALKQDFFRWRSPDGSEVMAYRADHAYRKDVRQNFEAWDGTEDALIVYGVTDHGGAPTKEALRAIHEHPAAHCSTLEAFFKDRTTDYIVTEELLTGDFGPYANYSRIKYRNRMAEYALLNAERSALIAGRADRGYLRDCWEDVMFNQFHDILGGASIKDAYLDAEDQLGRAIATANQKMHFDLQKVTAKVQMLGRNPETIWNIVAWNLNAKPYRDYMEAEVQWAHEFDWYDKGICLVDEKGTTYPCQIIREKSVIPRFRSRFLFSAEVPSMGYKTLRLVQTGEEIIKPTVDPYHICTGRLEFLFSKDGVLERILDRKTGRKIAGPILRPVVYNDLGDTWCFNITRYETTPEMLSFDGFQVVEAGELMTELKGFYRIGDSRLEIYYRFYHDRLYFDLRYRICWSEKHRVLKLECQTSANAHTVAVPGGAIHREICACDVPMGPWIDLGDFSIAADAIFAYSMENRTLGLTLLRSPIYGDLRIREIDEKLDYDYIDNGIVEGKLRLSFEGVPTEMADALCNPPILIDEANHSGSLPPTHSYLSMPGDGVQLMAYKACEEGNGRIARLVEITGRETLAELWEGEILHRIPLKPFEIKTVRLSKEGWQEVNMLEEEITE